MNDATANRRPYPTNPYALLLRGTAEAGSFAPEDTDIFAGEENDTHPLSGGWSIVMGLLFAAPLWALIGAVVWILL